jgi:cytochrome bd-type quinol oxidase subunit 2
VLIIMGTIALAVMGLENSRLLSAMLTGLGTPFALAAVIFTPAVGFLLWRGIFLWYRTLSVVAVGALVFAWGFGQPPYLLPRQLTIAQAAPPVGTEVLLSIVTLLVVVLVLPSLALLVYLDQRAPSNRHRAESAFNPQISHPREVPYALAWRLWSGMERPLTACRPVETYR